MNGNYEAFLRSKATIASPVGFDAGPMNGALMDFQRASVDFALRQGRAALYLSTGLGKSICQLEWLDQCIRETNKPGLLLAPLAVAKQFEREASKFGYDAHVIRDMTTVGPGINIVNYDRLDKIDPSVFGAVSMDEASILKSYTGRTSRALIEAFAHVPYRLCATATPAPNDHAELGSQAEFLGIMTQAEMLVRWFINDTNDTGVWRLKGHARSSFYDWMASWARMAETPADLGFDASRFVLPPLNIIRHQVQAEARPAEGMLFDAHVSATNMHDLKRQTSRERARLALDIVLNWQPCGSQNTPLIGERNTPQTQMFESVGSSSLVPETTPRNTVALTTAPTKTNGSEPRNSRPPSISGEGKDTPPTKNTEIASRMQSNPHPDKTQQTTSQKGSKSNSASQSTTTTPCSKTKADCAEYAGGTDLTDTDISALTTATQPEQSEGFCATSAILRSDYSATTPMHLIEHRPTSKPLRLPAWVLWCDTNDEQLHLEREFGDLAISITGAMSSDRKEELHEAWLRGDRPVLITKSSIFGYGMNWQHCHNVVFVGRTFSYEMWFQAVRRCWRFGQTKPVNVHLAVAQGEDQIGRVIDRKGEDHKAMMAGMAEAQRRNAGAASKVKVQYNPTYMGRLPKWLISA